MLKGLFGFQIGSLMLPTAALGICERTGGYVTGVLIPRDLDRAPGIRPNEIRVGIALQRALPDDVWIWYNSPQHSTRPGFVLIAPEYGIGGIDVYDWSPIDIESVEDVGLRVAGRTVADPVADLGRKLEELRLRVQSLRPEPSIFGFLMLPNFREDELSRGGLAKYLAPGTVVTGDQLTWAGLEKVLRRLPKPLDSSVLREVRARLYPDTQFTQPRLVNDENRIKRQSIRLQLDAEQESIARSLSDGITFIYGVTGSGKSLVLSARARVLSTEHPDWKIQMLCYNRTLVRYLHELVGRENSRVEIDTFYAWAGRLGLHLPRIQSEDSAATEESVERALARGIGTETCDAILVDEGQDFSPSWLKFAHRALRPRRGGMVVACDLAQAIYREEILANVFPHKQCTNVKLTRNYRNTAQIGHFAIGAVFGNQASAQIGQSKNPDGRNPPLAEFVLNGPPVQLVWADRWDAQAKFVAQEIRRLVDERRAGYRDIAVLYTQYMGTVKRILPALEGEKIPYFWVNQNRDTRAAMDLTDNSVKVMTVHSSKGMEFPIVFLFGVEALRVPDTLKDASIDEANLTRVAYVGITRAQDILYLTYTRTNPIVDRALRLAQWAEFKNYPEDYDFN